jgi:hypothetical protein
VDVGPLMDTLVVCCLAVVFLHVGSLFFYLLYIGFYKSLLLY